MLSESCPTANKSTTQGIAVVVVALVGLAVAALLFVAVDNLHGPRTLEGECLPPSGVFVSAESTLLSSAAALEAPTVPAAWGYLDNEADDGISDSLLGSVCVLLLVPLLGHLSLTLY